MKISKVHILVMFNKKIKVNIIIAKIIYLIHHLKMLNYQMIRIFY